MASGRLADYLGKGLASERPATLDLHPEAIGFWYATDTNTLSAWDGTAWQDDLSGGGIPDAPSDGTIYGRKDGSWAAVGSGGGVQSIVAGAGVSVDDTDPENPIISATGGGGGGAAVDVTYDNSTSGLSATDVQAAIDEIASGAGGGGVTSPTIQRIITSTNPNVPLVDGDLLYVLPTPKVVDVAYSAQTYGGADSVTSITVLLPAATAAGDLILVFTGSSYAPATPAGYTRVANRDSPRTQSATGMGYSCVFSKVADATDSGKSLVVTQPTSGRFAGVAVIVRSSTGVGSVAVSSNATGNGASASDMPHPLPSVVADVPGCMALATFSCALAATGSVNNLNYPAGWIPVTPTSSPGSPTYSLLRHWLISRRMRLGDDSATFAPCTHSASSHDWSSVAVLLKVNP